MFTLTTDNHVLCLHFDIKVAGTYSKEEYETLQKSKPKYIMEVIIIVVNPRVEEESS